MLEAADRLQGELRGGRDPRPPRRARRHEAGRQVLRVGGRGASRSGSRSARATWPPSTVDAGAAHRRQEGSRAAGGHRAGAVQAHGAHAARSARGRARPARGQQHPRAPPRSSSSRHARATAASSTPASAATATARRRSRSRPRRRSGSCPTRSSARPSADDLHVVRPAEHGRGGVGEGVLSGGRGTAAPAERRPTSAQLLSRRRAERRGGSLLLGGVPLWRRSPSASGTPTYVYNAEVIRRQLPRAGRGARGGAAPDLLRGEGQQQPRGAPRPARPGRRRRHRLRRRAGPGAGGGISARPHRLQRGGQDAPPSCEAAVEAGIGHIHLESAAELAALGPIASRLGSGRTVGIRVNPDVTADTHPLHRHRPGRHQVRGPVRPGGRRSRSRCPAPAARARHHRDAHREPAARSRRRIAGHRAAARAGRRDCRAGGIDDAPRHSTSAAGSGSATGRAPLDPAGCRGGGAADARRPGSRSCWSRGDTWWAAPGCCSPRCSPASTPAARISSSSTPA